MWKGILEKLKASKNAPYYILAGSIALTVLVSTLVVTIRSKSKFSKSHNAGGDGGTATGTYLSLSTVESDCGGVFRALTYPRYIEYKKNSSYGSNERCAWIITSSSTKVQVKVLQHDFQPGHSGLVFGEVNRGQYVRCSKWEPQDGNKAIELSTPAVIYFTSDDASEGGEFVIEIMKVIRFPEHLNVYAFPVFHTSRPFGSFSPSITLNATHDTLKNEHLRAALMYQPWQTDEPVSLMVGRNKVDTASDACYYSATAYEFYPYHEYNDVGACAMSPNLTLTHPVTNPIMMATKEAVLVLFWSHADFGCRVQWDWDWKRWGNKPLGAPQIGH